MNAAHRSFSDAAAVKDPYVVLAHPRTGSSLLMQTLVILGLPWVGQYHRADLGTEANPRGYFEDPEILARGLTEEQVARAGSVDGRAVKIGLSNMVQPGRLGQWRALDAGRARLFISFRCPLESAISLRCFNPRMAEFREIFIQTMAFLYNYTREYVALAHILTGHVSGLKDRTALIPYALHIDDPREFVCQVARFAGLAQNLERQAQAIANIEAALYRVKLSDMPEEYRQWYDKTPAKQVYEMLCESPDPWAKIVAWADDNAVPCAVRPECRPELEQM